MDYTYKIATLNINGISAQTRLNMLEEFLYKHHIDLAMLQEVTNSKINKIRRYIAYINIGTEGRGTAILAKDNYLITNIQRIPTGRGITAHFNGIKTINIYAPSGSKKKREREDFYNGDVARLLTHYSDNMVLAGDFNCVLTPSDCTGSFNVSRALTRLVTGLDLVDVGEANQRRIIYTHHTAQGASRLDRIYLSRQLMKSKQGVETIAAAFTDYLAVMIRVSLSTPCTTRGKGYWRMNPTYLDEQHLIQTFRQHWEMWKKKCTLLPVPPPFQPCRRGTMQRT
jgi:endonuclease/exonuclease/phosphatase family metal-dependent hydrolase